ncbi:hypothetical protein ACLOJK_010970 [Asimina triloba]
MADDPATLRKISSIGFGKYSFWTIFEGAYAYAWWEIMTQEEKRKARKRESDEAHMSDFYHIFETFNANYPHLPIPLSAAPFSSLFPSSAMAGKDLEDLFPIACFQEIP